MESRIEQAGRRLAEAVRYPSISRYRMEDMDLPVFKSFLDFLEEAYPAVHSKLERTLINGYSPVYRWKGRDGDRLPALFLAHYDVVPALEEGWTHQGPFSGVIADGSVWGRGSIDNKSSVIGLMETVEYLLEENFQPERDLWIAFGFDEEVNGRFGAKKIVEWFGEKKIRFEFVLDEGGAVSDGSMMGIKEPIAVIALAEKASASFEFVFTGEEGHSSTPPAHTSLGYMAEFIHKVEGHPLPVRMTETVEKMLQGLAPYKSGFQGKVLARPRLFFPLLKPTLLANKQTAALLRSTVAFTMSSSGSAPNVLPKEAVCTANFRILQGDTSEGILRYLRELTGMSYEVRPIAVEEPSRIASTDSAAYAHLERTIGELFPDAVVIPYLMAGGTDSRYYEELADDVYRFQPLRLTEEDLALLHGTDEHLSLENIGLMLSFYQRFIETLD